MRTQVQAGTAQVPSTMNQAPQAQQPASTSQALPQRRNDLLSFENIENEGGGYPKASTLAVWKCTNRHGFRDIVTMVGGRPRVRRFDWERWLESRKCAA